MIIIAFSLFYIYRINFSYFYYSIDFVSLFFIVIQKEFKLT